MGVFRWYILLKCIWIAILSLNIHSVSTTNFIEVNNIKINWTVNDQTTTYFTMSSRLADGNYFAFGLSLDQSMGDDDVAVCQASNGKVILSHYYNKFPPRSAYLQPSSPAIGFSNIATSFSNGVAVCSFTRDNYLKNVTNYFDINKQYYILTATGPINKRTNMIAQHTNTPSSTDMIDFSIKLNTPNALNTTNTPKTPNTQNTTNKNVPTKSAPANTDNQGFIIKWKVNGKTTNFQMSRLYNSKSKNKRSTPAGVYFAFGFSTDQLMGNDDVAVCQINANGFPSLNHYFNGGGHTRPSLLLKSDSSVGYSKISTIVSDGNPVCAFDRQNSMPGVSNYFDSNNQYYILSAMGTVSGDLNKHSSRASSSSKLDFSKDGQYIVGKGQSLDIAKAQAHGCLMVFAWMFCASTGILFARYYKYIFPKVKLMNVQFWFFVHRPLMMSVPILSLVSFLIILSYMNWQWIDSSNQLEFVHSITGILTIVFSIVQVFLAFFRCDKDHPKRFIFNHFHRIFGISTFILAIISIYLGVSISDMNLGNSGWGIVVGWLIWIVIIPFTIEILQTVLLNNKQGELNKLVQKNKNKSEESLKKSEIDQNKTEDFISNQRRVETIKTTILLFHFIVALAFTLALVILIGLTNPIS